MCLFMGKKILCSYHFCPSTSFKIFISLDYLEIVIQLKISQTQVISISIDR